LLKLPENKVNLISVLPFDASVWLNAKFSNQSIRELNLEIEKLAKQKEVKIIKLHGDFIEEKSNTIGDLYTDGLHLSEKGNKIYTEELLKHL